MVNQKRRLVRDLQEVPSNYTRLRDITNNGVPGGGLQKQVSAAAKNGLIRSLKIMTSDSDLRGAVFIHNDDIAEYEQKRKQKLYKQGQQYIASQSHKTAGDIQREINGCDTDNSEALSRLKCLRFLLNEDGMHAPELMSMIDWLVPSFGLTKKARR